MIFALQYQDQTFPEGYVCMLYVKKIYMKKIEFIHYEIL